MMRLQEDDTLKSLGGFHRYREQRHGHHARKSVEPESKCKHEQTVTRSYDCREESQKTDRRMKQTEIPVELIRNSKNIRESAEDILGDLTDTQQSSQNSALSMDSQELYVLRMMQSKPKDPGRSAKEMKRSQIAKTSNVHIGQGTVKNKIPRIPNNNRRIDTKQEENHNEEITYVSPTRNDGNVGLSHSSSLQKENSNKLSCTKTVAKNYNHLNKNEVKAIQGLNEKVYYQREKCKISCEGLEKEIDKHFNGHHLNSSQLGENFERHEEDSHPILLNTGSIRHNQESISKFSDLSGSFDNEDILGTSRNTESKLPKVSKGLGGGRAKPTRISTTKVKLHRKGISKNIAIVGTKSYQTNGAENMKKVPMFQTIRSRNIQLETEKSDPRAKVMKVKISTRKGRISAEFTTIDHKNTPLHIACLTHYSSDFILEHLLDYDENAISTPNTSGELPIHYAAMDTDGVDPDVFNALVLRFPSSIHYANIDGSLPIHVACQVGAPSLFVIEKMLKLCPDLVFAKTNLRAPISKTRIRDEFKQVLFRCPHNLVWDLFCSDEEDRNELNDYNEYESEWSPLHLAVVNNAPPLVILTILDTDIECLNLTTDCGRTPLDCAKELFCECISENLPLKSFQNMFYAIEIMQIFEQDIFLEKELKIKANIVIQSLDTSDNYGWYLADAMVTGANLHKSLGIKNEHSEEKELDFETATGLTALHRAILRRQDPDKVQQLIEQRPECIDIVSRLQRKSPYELSKELLVQGVLNDDIVSKNLANTFSALQMMQNFKLSQNHFLGDSSAMQEIFHSSPKDRKLFGSTVDKYQYMKEIIANDQNGSSILGNHVPIDDDEPIRPPKKYSPPRNLKHKHFEISIPVGFRRLRKALLSSSSKFLTFEVLSNKLGYKVIHSHVWDKFPNIIGSSKLNDGEKYSNYIGATKVLTYFVPQLFNIDQHAVYETTEILEYNDFCFVVCSLLKEPDVPYGSEFETKLQTVIIDTGRNSCKMICSSQIDSIGMVLNVDDDWAFRKVGMCRASSYFGALAEMILFNAGDGSRENY